MQNSITKVNEALKGTDVAAIKSAVEELANESQQLGSALYAQTQADAASAGGDGCAVEQRLRRSSRRTRRSSTPRSWTRLRRSEPVSVTPIGAVRTTRASRRARPPIDPVIKTIAGSIRRPAGPGPGRGLRPRRRRALSGAGIPRPTRRTRPTRSQPLPVDLSAAELDLARQEAAERTADLQRVTAEYANYRKRVDRDRDAVRRRPRPP